MTTKRPRLFYGWLIVFVSAVGLFLGAPLMVFSFSVFFKSLVLDFHASRAAVSFSFSLFNIVGALLIPCTGMIIDRFGAKRVILVFTLLYGLALCSALWVGSSLWQLYLLFTILGVAMASGPAPVPYGVVISHWFNRHRGLALGVSMMGIGIGSVVVPIVAQHLITSFGWRAAFAIFGAAVLLLPLPVIAALLQNDPAQRGLQSDGDHENQLTQSQSQDKQGLTWNKIWHSPTFWILISIFSLAGASVHGAVLHMSAIFTDRGVTPERAAIATSLVGVAVMLGRLASGYLLDRLFAGTSGPLALVASFLVGVGMGAEVESMAYMISRYFGLASFGTAYGHAFGAFMIAGSAGVFLMGAGYDRFHSYTVPLAALCAAMVLALILLARLGPYRYGVAEKPTRQIGPMEAPSGA
jgi:MFS family permease